MIRTSKLGLVGTAVAANVRAMTQLSYLAQLCPLPHGMGKWQVLLWSKIFGWPVSSASVNMLNWGCKKLCFPAQLVVPQLQAVAERSAVLTFARLTPEAIGFDEQGAAATSWWNPDESIVARLQRIRMKVPERTVQALRGQGPLNGGRRDLGPQARLYNSILMNLNTNWMTVAKDRCRILEIFGEHKAEGWKTDQRKLKKAIDDWPEVLKDENLMVRMTCLRTLANGWCTSKRMPAGNGKWMCLFGCQAMSMGEECYNDSLHHYLRCPWLWAATEKAAMRWKDGEWHPLFEPPPGARVDTDPTRPENLVGRCPEN
jgi:hypothetical protein